MKDLRMKRFSALLLSLILLFCTASVGVSAKTGDPLFRVTDVSTRQGEEFTVTVTVAQAVSAASNPIAALDVSLKYDTNVFSVVSVTKGSGLNQALSKLEEGNIGLETGGYIYSDSSKIAGEIRWSMSTVGSFTFSKNAVFAVVKMRANDASNLEKDPSLTIEVTNAAKLNADKKTYTDITANFGAFTNKTTVAVNLATLCDWSYNKTAKTYTLVKFNDTQATYFTIPDTFNDGTNGTHPVTVISSSAFSDSPKIETVTLGKNLTSVGAAAFTGCKKLKLVTVFSPTTTFGANAFYGASTDFVIKCIKNSAADTYAKKNNIKVIYIGDLTLCTVTGVEASKYYTGSPIQMTNIRVVNESGAELRPGIDYSVTYENNTNIGMAAVLINGEGEYFGTLTYAFEILCPYHKAGTEYFTAVETYENCTLGGKLIETCSFCGYRNETNLPTKAHGTCSWKVLKDATCTDTGLEVYACADCNVHLKERTIAKIDHTTAWITTTAPTCYAAGEEKLMCTVCDEVFETKTLDMVDHDKQWVVTKAASCTEDGLRELKCTYCGEVYASEILPKGNGHLAASTWTVITEPTCTQNGTEARLCTICGEILEQKTLPALKHEAKAEALIVEPTCTKSGSKTVYCNRCGEIISTETIPALKHAPAAEWTTIVSVTCTTNGEEAQLCTRCGEKLQTRVVKATGHKEAATWTTLSEATCTESGTQVKLCTVCDAILGRKTNAALGHKTGSWITVVQPTCTTDGFRHKVCSRCGDAVQTETLKATDHTKTYVYTLAPTYKYTGTEKAVCSVCGADLKETRTVARVYPDLNGDRALTSADALLILQSATKLKQLTQAQLKSADCDGNQKVNSSDALIVLQISTGILTY